MCILHNAVQTQMNSVTSHIFKRKVTKEKMSVPGKQFYFSNTFCIQWIESMNVEPMDTEGQL